MMELPLYAVITTGDRGIRFCNRALAALVERDPEQVVGRDWDEVFDGFVEDQPAWDRFLVGRVTPQYHGRVRDAAGAVHDVFWSNVLLGGSGPDSMLASIGHDVTDSIAAAEMLAAANADRERLVAAVLAAEVEERARLAEALHDDTVQALTATLMQLDSALAGRGQPSTLARARDTLADALVRMRRLMFDLRPRLLDDEGLFAAISDLAEEFTRDDGFVATVKVPQRRLPRAVEELAYRTVREAVINCARHGRAAHIAITIDAVDGVLAGEVADDGVGFDPVAVGAREDANLHVGIASMIERVRLARGEIELESAPGAGTTVRFRIPI